MGDMLSQEEIDALLSGAIPEETTETSSNTSFESSPNISGGLTSQEADALGEIGNICMGTSATTLFTLLGQKVLITTPKVSQMTWQDLGKEQVSAYVAVKVIYTEGLQGANLLVLREEDVKIITDLMMGGDGTNTSGNLSDLHLSAISEAMNQMVGSSSTSMSSLLNTRIDISPPIATVIDAGMPPLGDDFDPDEHIIKISFKMVIGTLIDSEIMQILPMKFAKKMVDGLLSTESDMIEQIDVHKPEARPQNPVSKPQPIQQQQQQQHHPPQEDTYKMPYQNQQNYDYDDTAYMAHNEPRSRGPINVQPAQFQSFDDGKILVEKKNISLIMDVPLEVTVELGRTNKLIRDVLEFGPGSIIELDKLAGEPVDILVNGKVIAKGEVVVIDESFGVRITDIVHPSKRL